MDIAEKYLPSVEERIVFLQGRIKNHKDQVYGGVVEIMTTKNFTQDEDVQATNVRDIELKLKQIMRSIDDYEKELATLQS